MQRYELFFIDDADYVVPRMQLAEEGRYVQHADAQSALAAKDREIAKLREALGKIAAQQPSEPGATRLHAVTAYAAVALRAALARDEVKP